MDNSLNKLSSKIRSIPIQLEEIEMKDTFFQSLFIMIKNSKLIIGIGYSDDNRNRQEHHLNSDYIYPSFDKNIEIKII